MNRLLIITSLAAVISLVACSSAPVNRRDQQATAFADLRTAVTETVSDDDRQRDVLAIIDSLEKDIDELRALLVLRRTQLRELNADYYATREQFLEFASHMESHIQSGRRRALEQHLRLAVVMTEVEWDSLSKTQTTAMRSIAQSVQGM